MRQESSFFLSATQTNPTKHGHQGCCSLPSRRRRQCGCLDHPVSIEESRPSSRQQALQNLSAACGGGDGEAKSDGEKKFITREEEPEQYWQTAGERKGENPMMTPLPYIVIFGFSTPFIILAIAFANGWIKAPLIR